MRTPLFAVLLLGTACSLDEGELGASLDGGAVPDQSAADAVVPSDGNAIVDARADAAPDALPPPDAGSCDPNACPGERCESGACSFYASCNEMRTDTTRATGAHKLRDPKPTIFDAWCDMSTDNGGWTLVGRSVFMGTSGSFGWKKATGTIADDSKPYSLDAAVHGLVFTEALVGGYLTGKGWFGSLYKLGLPANFLGGFKSSAGAAAVSKVGGACSENSPAMFSNVGFTDMTDVFFTRNNTSSGSYGLRAGGFALAFGIADCPNAAYLDTLQGMIFVR